MSEPVSHLEAPIEGDLANRLTAARERCAEVEAKLGEPDAQNDRAAYVKLLEEHADLSPVAKLFAAYEKAVDAVAEAAELATSDDPEMAELAGAELAPTMEAAKQAARAVREHLLDEEDAAADRCIVEIRAGAGGDEAALFVADLFGMYSAYAERARFKIEVLDQSETALGGFKEIMFSVQGKRAYGRLRFESGGHRVQRVPATETQGRIHTSAVTVAVLEEVEEKDIQIDENDLRIDTFCASGPGGQKVNKTSSAVRITHLPTGTVVAIQDEKSQHRNKAKAMRVLASRIRENEEQKRRAESDEVRRSLIGSGDRSDRIRTYNFPQNRCTDHRINLTLYNLDRVVAGELEELLDALEARDKEDRVASL